MTELSNCLHSERAFMYKLLSECYYPPNKKINKIIGNLNSLLCSFLPELAKYVPDVPLDIASLEIDFSRLFIGPFKVLCPPFGSVYMDNGNTLMGDTTIEVRNIYEKEGLINNGTNNIPDHIAVELEFMYYLVYNEFNEHSNKDDNLVEIYADKQKKFLNNYLGKWVFDFVESVEKQAITMFYKEIAILTRNFIIYELKQLTDFEV